MRLRYYRWSKKFLILVATLPLLQAQVGGCDIENYLLQNFTQNLAFGIFSTVTTGVRTTLLTFYPSADILQTLLGGNTTQWFHN